MTNRFPNPDASNGVTNPPWSSGWDSGTITKDADSSRYMSSRNGSSTWQGYDARWQQASAVTVSPSEVLTVGYQAWGYNNAGGFVSNYTTGIVLTFFNSTGGSVGTFTSPVDGVNGEFNTWTVTVPAGAAYIGIIDFVQGATTMYFTNIYVSTVAPDTSETTTPPPPPPVANPTGLNIMLEVQQKYDGTNLLSNPSGHDSAFPWVSDTNYSIVSTTGSSDWTYLHFEAGASGNPVFYSESVSVDNSYYTGLRFLWGGYSDAVRVGVAIEWLDATDAIVSTSDAGILNPASAANGEFTWTLGPTVGAYKARYRFTLYRYDGTSNTATLSGDYFEAREVTLLQGATVASVSNIQPWQADGYIWTDVAEPTHEISIERAALDSGLLAATVLKDSYDPATGGFIKPGLPVRVRTSRTDGSWEEIYTGKIDKVYVTYPRGEVTRISINASDNMTRLSNIAESYGVGTIGDLPYILESSGVAWKVNGNSNQVSSATQVSSSDNATLLDQIIVTRDSDKAYAWVDRYNVLNAIHRPSSATPEVFFSDVANAASNYDSYSSVDVSFSTGSCINIVEITYLRYDAGTGETTEIKYGPYVDNASLAEWGPYKSTFTLQGGTEDEATMQAFANDVFAKNAQPAIRANALVMPVKDARSRDHAAAIDLYDVVSVTYSNKVNSTYRVTYIKHEITPGKWLTEYGFEHPDSVALPLVTGGV